MYEAYNSSKFTGDVASQYQSWRLKSATLKIIPAKFETTVGQIFAQTLTAGAQIGYGPILNYVWDTNATYSTNGGIGGLAATSIALRKGSRSYQYQLGEWNKPITTTIRAGSQDSEWMNGDFQPGVNPNTGMFWCPVLYMALWTPAVNCTGIFTYTYEWTITVEVRGTK